MSQSPNIHKVYPPIEDFKKFKQNYNTTRALSAHKLLGNEAANQLLEFGGKLLGHCDFLIEKLSIKVCLRML